MAEQSDAARGAKPVRTIGGTLAGVLRSRIATNFGAAWSRLRAPHRGPRPTAELHDLPAVFWLAIVAIAVVQVAVIFDADSVAWARGLPSWVHDVFQVVTDWGRSNGVLQPTGIALLVLLFGDWRGIARSIRAAWAELGALIGYVFFAVAGAGILVNILKQLIGRARPVNFDEEGWLSFDAFSFDYANASFPSGHSTTAGAAMTALALIFPRLRVPIIVVGVLIAFSRVVVGAHFPSDAVAGLAVGIAFSYLTARFLLGRRIAFGLDRAGHIRPRLGATRAAGHRRGIGAVIVAPFQALLGLPGAARPRAG